VSENKIAVVRGGALGDFILTLPVLTALRQNFPSSKLALIASPRHAELALASGLADESMSIESRALAGFFARDGVLDAAYQEFFSKCSVVISYLYDPDEFFQKNVRRCTAGQFIQGPHRPAENQEIHASELFLNPLQRLAVFDAHSIPEIKVFSVQSKGTVQKLAMHPGSGSESKNWPLASWRWLMERIIHESGLQILLILGESEFGKKAGLLRSLDPARIEICENEPLTQVARKLKHCELFVGHDSGITHLAAAVGIPVLALWGVTNENIWRPRSKQSEVVRHPAGLTSLTVEEVYGRVRGLKR